MKKVTKKVSDGMPLSLTMKYVKVGSINNGKLMWPVMHFIERNLINTM